MNNEKSAQKGASQENEDLDQNKSNQDKPLPFHNPLNPNDHRQITQEDLDNEQQYKEALSERD